MNSSEETLERSAFASARTLDAGSTRDGETRDGEMLMSCASESLRATVQRGLKQVPLAREEDVWRVLLLERWLPLSWSKGKGACDEAAMEWLWDIATTATCADVRLAARDALLVALGFECKWGAVCDGPTCVPAHRNMRTSKAQCHSHRNRSRWPIHLSQCRTSPWQLEGTLGAQCHWRNQTRLTNCKRLCHLRSNARNVAGRL